MEYANQLQQQLFQLKSSLSSCVDFNAKAITSDGRVLHAPLHVWRHKKSMLPQRKYSDCLSAGVNSLFAGGVKCFGKVDGNELLVSWDNCLLSIKRSESNEKSCDSLNEECGVGVRLGTHEGTHEGTPPILRIAFLENMLSPNIALSKYY